MENFIVIIIISIVFIAGFFFGLGHLLNTKSGKKYLSDLFDLFKAVPGGKLFLPIIGFIALIAFLYGQF